MWKLERAELSRCPDSLVVVANKAIFGGGPYSVAGSTQLRMVGKKKWPVSEISIGTPTSKSWRDKKTGAMRNAGEPHYLPKSFKEKYHPTGNSVGYMIQTAHLMGADPIYLLGFTLQSKSGYFFGVENPVTRKRSIYDSDRALGWLRWYETRYPGRVRLWPGWTGPIYDAFHTVNEQEVAALIGGSE